MIFEIRLSSKYFRSESVVCKDTGDETFIVSEYSGSSAEEDALFTLSGVGRSIWQMLDGTNTIQFVIQRLTEKYDVSEEQARQDVVAFLEQLASLKMIEE